MRRWCVRILVCLTLGLLTTVAVAWTSAVWIGFGAVPGYGRALRNSAHEPIALIDTFRRVGAQRWTASLKWTTSKRGDDDSWRLAYSASTAEMVAALGSRWAAPPRWGRIPEPSDLDHFPDPIAQPIWVQDAHGWPWLAVWCEWSNSGVSLSPGVAHLGGGIDLTLHPPGPFDPFALRALPCRPIPAGLAADTFLFAFAWIVLLSTTQLIRTRLRLRRGHCPACGYDLAGNTTGVCPECGKGAPS